MNCNYCGLKIIKFKNKILDILKKQEFTVISARLFVCFPINRRDMFLKNEEYCSKLNNKKRSFSLNTMDERLPKICRHQHVHHFYRYFYKHHQCKRLQLDYLETIKLKI